MTNRDMLNQLDNNELPYIYSTYILHHIGKQYGNSIKGIADWLGKPVDEYLWKVWREAYSFYAER